MFGNSIIGDLPEGYTVDIEKLLDDDAVYRAVINGYPYKTPEQLGVADKYDAYIATKQAIYSVLYGYDVDSHYRGVDERGKNIKVAIEKIVKIARTGTQTQTTPLVKFEKVGNLVEDSINNTYYSQTYNVTSDVSIREYTVTSTSGFPKNTIIVDEKNNKKTTFSSGEKFKILIPKDSIKETNIEGTITAEAECKSFPVFYGKKNDKLQPYAVTYAEYANYTSKTSLNVKMNTGKIQINKTDDETKEPIANVTFQLLKQDGTVLANATTDKNGVATFSSLYEGSYILKEIATNDRYILNESKFDVDVKYNKTTSLSIENEHKKGNLKIYKVDKDNNKISLGNVEFQLYSEEFEKIIGTYYTDANGELKIENLRIGDYKLIETKTNKWYNLADDTNIKIEWDQETKEIIENELKKGQIKIIKVDEEDNEVRIEGVEFEILNENDEVLEKVITDKNGEALTSQYAVRDFNKLKIRETKTLEEYALLDKVEIIELEENKLTEVVLENEKIKGQIKIVKTSKDDNLINGEKAGTAIQNVKFKVYDSNNNVVDEIITDENGIAITKELYKGSYTIKEVESGEWYLLNDNIFSAEIKENHEIVEINITNESEKPDIDIEKTGIIQTTAKQEIRYDFQIKNTGNVPLDNFTWYDYLPTDYVKITKLITGTYNQNLNYAIYYKTNKNDYKLLKDNLSTQVNNYIDFSNLTLEKDEYITEFKIDFGTVDVGFESVIDPYIFVRVNNTVKNDDTFTNKTRIEGNHKGYLIYDEDDHTTKVYEKQINVKKLPRTGC